MASIFTKIINNEIPCYKVAETENCFAFLDINPNAEGHTLCIPKQEVDNLFDLDTKLYNELMMFSKKVAKALKKAIPCERVAMSVIGLEVPHAHVHLIPINEMKDVTFRNKVIFSKNEFQDIANNIKSYL
ncbi:MAG: HIT family protein [Flavobacteriaceae bacterium]|nr:HIT family protein [Flavobacteriaceae bacterium]